MFVCFYCSQYAARQARSIPRPPIEEKPKKEETEKIEEEEEEKEEEKEKEETAVDEEMNDEEPGSPIVNEVEQVPVK